MRKKLLDIKASLAAELLFTFLPFLVIFLVLAYTQEIPRMLYLPEWSFAAAILSGQAIVKFILGLLEFGDRVNLGIVALVVTATIVVILAPSLVVLSLILVTGSSPTWLAIMQIVLFVLAVVLFLFLGRVSHEILLRKGPPEKN